MDNLYLMRERLRVRGGTIQQARMIKDKKEALKRAIKYSYQGAQVQAVGKTEPAVALINPIATDLTRKLQGGVSKNDELDTITICDVIFAAASFPRISVG